MDKLSREEVKELVEKISYGMGSDEEVSEWIQKIMDSVPNLTKRQLVCFGVAAAVGVPSYLLARSSIGNTGAMFFMMAVAFPAFLLAMYEKDGLPLEKVVRNIIRARFLRPGVRPYRTENIYAPFTHRGAAGKEDAIAESKKSKARPRKGR